MSNSTLNPELQAFNERRAAECRIRDKQIVTEFDRGADVLQLAKQHKTSVDRISKILRANQRFQIGKVSPAGASSSPIGVVMGAENRQTLCAINKRFVHYLFAYHIRNDTMPAGYDALSFARQCNAMNLLLPDNIMSALSGAISSKPKMGF